MSMRKLEDKEPVVPPPPPPIAIPSMGSLSLVEGDISLSAMFESPRVAANAPASPATVEKFLAGVSEELEKQAHKQGDFWPDEGNQNSVLPVPGPMHCSTQLVNEGESGEYKPFKKSQMLTSESGLGE